VFNGGFLLGILGTALVDDFLPSRLGVMIDFCHSTAAQEELQEAWDYCCVCCRELD
jgi:hypothetical protein